MCTGMIPEGGQGWTSFQLDKYALFLTLGDYKEKNLSG